MCIVLKDEDSMCDAPSNMQNCIASFPAASSNCREDRNVNTPKLLRRLPMTDDTLAFHQHMEQKIMSGQSNSSKQSLLRWQILMPVVVSDIKSFKSENPAADHITFMEWYTGKDGSTKFPYFDDEINYLPEVYDACNPVPASDQKVMFQAEGEAEKAFSIIEKLNIIETSTEVLIYALNSVYILLVDALKEFCLWNYDHDGHHIYAGYSSFDDDLRNLRSDIDKVIDMMSMTRCGVNKNNSDSNDDAYIIIDTISLSVERLEEQAVRVKEISEYLDMPSSPEKCHIVSRLCKEGYFEPKNNSELQIIFNSAKKISKGSNNHDWHSHDGRELGVPSKKFYEIQCQKSIRLTDAYDNHDLIHKNDDVMTHYFTAIAENNKLRVSFNIRENEN